MRAVGSRNKAFPDIPTLEEQGQQPRGSQIRGFVGLWAPAKTLADILEKLSDACRAGGKDERVQKVLSQFYLEPAMSMADAQKKFEQGLACHAGRVEGARHSGGVRKRRIHERRSYETFLIDTLHYFFWFFAFHASTRLFPSVRSASDICLPTSSRWASVSL